MIRWGIIGAGRIAKRFAKSLSYEQDAKLYAISGRNEEKLKSFQQEYPCEKTYVGHDLLINDDEIDAVYVALPHDMHAVWSMKALQAKKAVLCEKPAAMNEEEVKQIIHVADENHTLYMEAMKSRFEPAYMKVKELIQTNQIGTITSLKAQMSSIFSIEQHPNSYIIQPNVGGALLDVGCYCVNWVTEFFDGEPSIRINEARIKDGIDSYIDAQLLFNHGYAEVISGMDCKKEPIVEIVGTKGKMVVEKTHRPDKINLILGNKEEEIALPYIHDDFFAQIHHFNTLLQQGKIESDVMPWSASVVNARLMDRIKKAVKKAVE